jgi:ketosteroid isomerase-like protein
VTPAELIKRLMAETSVDGWSALLHPDVEHQWLPGGAVHRGLSETRAYAEQAIHDADRPEPVPLSITEAGDRAVVRGQLRFVQRAGERPYVRTQAAAWLVTVQDDRLRRVEAFSSWEDAEKAAAFTADEETRHHRLGARWLLVARDRLGRFPVYTRAALAPMAELVDAPG